MEVLLAMFLLGIIMMYLAQYQRSVIQTRSVVLNDGDFYTEIRLSTTIIEKDVRMIYSPIAAKPSSQPDQLSLLDQQKLSEVLRGEERQTSEYWLPVMDLTGARPSRFQGAEAEISFISASNVRVYRESLDNIFTKIKYELRSGTTDFDKEKGTKVLTRIVNRNVFHLDDTDEEYQKVYPLIGGIKDFKFEFFNKKDDRWENSWDSESSEFTNRIPEIIRLTLTVLSKQDKVFTQVYQFRTEAPLHELPVTF